MCSKIMNVLAIFFYLIAGGFNALMLYLGASMRISAEKLIPAVAGVFLAAAGVLENVKEFRHSKN